MKTTAQERMQPKARLLVVVFHGAGGDTGRLAGVRAAVAAQFPTADILVPRLSMGWVDHLWLSNADPVAVTKQVMDEVESRLLISDYDEIVLVGYSMGGILARKLVVYAFGEHEDAPFEAAFGSERARRPWAQKITRIVLIAGMNRGWTFAPSVNIVANLTREAVYSIARCFGRSRFLAKMRRGAPFLADMRIQWLSLMRHEHDAEHLVIVQLLGTIDDIVSPDDNIDLQTGSRFYYLDVPRSGHFSILDFDTSEIGRERRAIFLTALTANTGELEQVNIMPSVGAHQEVDTTVRHVLFVIHGIRDYGFWTSHLARFIIGAARSLNNKVIALTPTYGYFAMLPFVLPHTRRAKIRWFMDEYTEALARFPNAEQFSYVGHSNGTYLLAGALQDYTSCHFSRVVFAGSVVRSDYPWPNYLATGRVQRVLNYVATADWVVAIFPRFLARFGADVGGAGHDGFKAAPLRPIPAAAVNNAQYVIGSHFAALGEYNWKAIAAFIVTGQLPSIQKPVFLRRPRLWVRILAFIAPLLWILIAGIVLAPVVLYVPTPHLATFHAPHWLHQVRTYSLGARTCLTLLWIWLIRAIVTRV